MPVMDSDGHCDPESEQGKTGCKPESDEALPPIVDGRTVIRLRIVSPALRAASGVIPENWPRRPHSYPVAGLRACVQSR